MGFLIKNGKFYAVGAIITRTKEGVVEYLLIDRVQIPLGWACVAGHVDEGEDSLTAMKREVKEESGLDVTGQVKVISEEVKFNICKHGHHHTWDVYVVEWEGDLKVDSHEAKDHGWFSVEQIKKLELEPVWKYFFEKLKIL